MTFGIGKPRSGRNRQGRVRSTFDRRVTLRRLATGMSAQTGKNFAPRSAHALKASLAAPSGPTSAPPASGSAAPLDEGGWKGWWTASGIADPPSIDAVLSAGPETPLIWRVSALIGAAEWGAPEVYEASFPADVRERAGSEGDQSGVETGRTVATFRVRAANADALGDDLGDVPTRWELVDGSERWDITEALASWAADRYVDLRAVRRQSARG